MILISSISLLLATTLAVPSQAAPDGAPVAVDDVYTTPVDENLSEDAPGVLGNDSDPENDPLSAVLVSSSGANGMLFLEPDGSFEYEPASLGTDVFTYQASDGTSLSNVATITFTVTPGQSGLAYSDEQAYHHDLMSLGYERHQESFEDEAVWAPTRSVAAPSITSQDITWSSNYPTNGIRTGSGPAVAGAHGFFSLPHGNYLAGPQCLTPGVCTDGWRGTSTRTLVAIGGFVDGTGAGAKLRIILDDDPARSYDMGFVVSPRFVGVVDAAGFNSFEFRELEGTSEDAFYLFADHFTFAFQDGTSSGPPIHGCGPNPIGSMRILAGTASLGNTITLGIDNPLGSQAAGSASMLILSTTPAQAYPCGTVLPRLGMNWEEAAGELLVSLLSAHRLTVLNGPAWAGPGIPAAIDVAIPNLGFLVGLPLHVQGALIDPTASVGHRFGLTEAVHLTIGP